MFNSVIKSLNTRKFYKNEGGSLSVLMGISILFIAILIAVSIDLAEVYRGRVNFQNALDAGTLAATKIIAANNDKQAAQEAGEKVFLANLGNLDPNEGAFTISPPQGGCGGGLVVGSATLDHKVFFDIIHKVSQHSGRKDHVRFEGSVSVECTNQSIELALVLDNSGSMAGEKMTALKSAAKDLVKTLYDALEDSPKEDAIQVSLVPFNGAVNVGVQNKNASWVDIDGLHPNHYENLNWQIDPGLYDNGGLVWNKQVNRAENRLSLFWWLRVPWAGCLEARTFPYNTNDAPASSADPETLFMPMFAPDEPDQLNLEKNYVRSTTAPKVTCVRFKLKNGDRDIPPENQYCDLWSDGLLKAFRHPQDPYYLPRYNDGIEYQNGQYIGGSVATNPVGAWIENEFVSEIQFANSYLQDDWNFPMTIQDHPRSVQNMGYSSSAGTGGQLNRQDWTWKYRKSGRNWPAVDTESAWLTAKRGPNFGCYIPEITPLSPDRQDVYDGLEAMVADGSTNIANGAVWGWRTLSAGAPYSEGRESNVKDNKKIMIVMSDGNNSHYQRQANGSIYSIYGFAKNDRIFEGVPELENADYTAANYGKAMDSHLVKTCENAKADSIEVITIAFDVPDGSSIKSMLNSCASPNGSGGKQYYDVGDAEELKQTFKDITSRLSNLTLKN